jgi:hypothetical protein
MAEESIPVCSGPRAFAFERSIYVARRRALGSKPTAGSGTDLTLFSESSTIAERARLDEEE